MKALNFPLKVFSLSGSDATRFLHGMLSCDIKKLSSVEGACSRFVFLEPNGRLLNEGYVLSVSAQSYLIFIATEQASEFFKKLDHFLITDDVRIEEISKYQEFALVLEGTAPSKESLITSLSSENGAKIFQAKMSDEELLLPLANFGPYGSILASKKSLQNVAWISDEEFLKWRVENAVVMWGKDYFAGQLCVEFPLQDAISLNKGCYIGQEVVAKATVRGKPPHNTVLLSQVPECEKGAGVLEESGTVVGKLLSRYGNQSLAWLRRPAVESEAPLFVEKQRVHIEKVLS